MSRIRNCRIGANQNDGDPQRWEIVGVVGDVHHSSLTRAATPEIYLPFQQNSWNWGNFFVRAAANPAALTRSFSEAIRAGDKTVPVSNVQPLTEAISDTVAQAQFYTLLFALFGVTGLLLTLTGIYGVISYTVAQRTQEIGIRLALGAQSGDVFKLVMKEGFVLILAGLLIGIPASLAATRVLDSLLFGITPTDSFTFLIIALLLTAAALVACFVPARRAAKTDPMVALRYE